MLENRCPASRRRHLRCVRRCAAPRAARSRELQALPSRAQRPLGTGGAAPGGRGSNTVTGHHGRPQVGCQRYLGGSQRSGCLGWTEENGQPLVQAGKEAKTSRGQRKDRDPGGTPGQGGRLVLKPGSQTSPKYPVFLVSFQQVFFN